MLRWVYRQFEPIDRLVSDLLHQLVACPAPQFTLQDQDVNILRESLGAFVSLGEAGATLEDEIRWVQSARRAKNLAVPVVLLQNVSADVGSWSGSAHGGPGIRTLSPESHAAHSGVEKPATALARVPSWTAGATSATASIRPATCSTRRSRSRTRALSVIAAAATASARILRPTNEAKRAIASVAGMSTTRSQSPSTSKRATSLAVSRLSARPVRRGRMTRRIARPSTS